jgi:gluconate 2-dehydrogenase gamma chain
MNRRDSLKALGLTVSTTVLLDSCKSVTTVKTADGVVLDETGRQKYEVEREKKLLAEKFFDAHEMATITLLADLIIPKDEHSGSASDAKVPDFIEFIVKDEPEHALPMRGGLRWMDVKCLNKYNNEFKSCTPQQQLEILGAIAYPMQAKPDMAAGVTFFNKMRELTSIGFFTSKMGIEDLGYKGNAPTKWEGVPADVLKQYGLEGV